MFTLKVTPGLLVTFCRLLMLQWNSPVRSAGTATSGSFALPLLRISLSDLPWFHGRQVFGGLS